MTDKVAGDPQQVIADLERRLDESLAQQAATADVLKVISRSTFDLQTVLETLIKSATELCGANRGSIFLREGEVFPLKAASSATPEFLKYWAANPARAGRGSATSRVIASGKIEVIPDIFEDPDMKMSAASLNRIRAALGVPMLRNGRVEGVLVLTRPEPGPFTKSQIDLVQTFADQAMIAIENARLFDEVQTKTASLQESLQHQTATSEVLAVISRSPGELNPVFQTILASATNICDAQFGLLLLYEDDGFRCASMFNLPPAFAETFSRNPVINPPPIDPLGRLIATRQLVHVVDVKEEPAYLTNFPPIVELVELGGARSLLLVPMLREKSLVGVIAIFRQTVHAFSDKQIDLVTSFGSQAVIAIENARLLSELRERTDDLSESLQHQTATSEVLKVISRSPGELDPVFQTILTSATAICDAQFGNLFVLHEDGGFRCASLFNLPPAFADAFSRNPVIYPPPIDPLGRVIATRQLVHVVDVRQEPAYVTGFPAIVELVELGGARTVLLVPMLKEDDLVGVIAIFRQTVLPFSDKQIDLVRSFASQAVIAIENARLLNETKEALERQTATADILRVISQSPTDVRPVFDAIVLTAVRLFRCDLAFFLRCHGATFSQAALVGSQGSRMVPDLTPVPIDPDTNFPSRAIVSKKNLHLPDWSTIDLPEHERHIREKYGINSSLFLPLLRAGECVGLLALARKRASIFGESEIALAESFRDQALIAIENTRLFNETQEALERQTATADILKVIASSPTDAQPVFEAIAERSKRLVDALSTTVFRLEDGVMHLRAFTSTDPEADATLQAMFPAPLSDFSWGEAISRGEIHRVVDTELEIEAMRELARLRGFRSMLFVPLLRDRKPIGVIAVTREEPGPFIEHHVQQLQTFADQAVIAIENVRLFDEVQARTEDLRESLQQQTATADVLKVISRSAFDLKSVLTTLTESAKSLCGASLGIICLRDGEVMRLQAESGCTPAFVDFMQTHPIKPGRETITGRVFLDGKAVHVADVQLDPEYRFGDAPTIGAYRAVLAVPLMRDGAVEGVLLLGRPGPGPFSQRQLDLVQTFADQAVIAIENVRLFEQVQERTRELSLSLDELRTAQDRLVQTEKLASLGQLTAGIAHEIKNPLNFVNNFSALSGELIDELNELLGSAAVDGKVRQEIDELTHMLKGNLEKVVQHGKRANSIVKNMLLHSREGSGERRPADINTIVEESLNLAYHGARAEKSGFNITLQRDLDPSAGMVDLYPQEITRVFLNLISNGFYAANKRREAGDNGFEPLLTATTKNLGNRVEIRIRDNGTGIPADVKEKMFNPFFTTKPAGEGTGLGLSMSHDIIVKQHGGKIDVETEPGAFTEFIITLPRAAAQAGGRN